MGSTSRTFIRMFSDNQIDVLGILKTQMVQLCIMRSIQEFKNRKKKKQKKSSTSNRIETNMNYQDKQLTLQG